MNDAGSPPVAMSNAAAVASLPPMIRTESSIFEVPARVTTDAS